MGNIDDIEVVTTFEMEGGDRNITEVNEEIRDAIKGKMSANPKWSIEDFAFSKTPCPVDEDSNQNCSAAKENVENILSTMKAYDAKKRKEKLLPQQGECLHDIGKLLRKLHRTSDTEASSNQVENIKCDIQSIREKQFRESPDSSFIVQLISILELHDERKAFAIRWLQLELDVLSRLSLPQLQRLKNHKWKSLMNARTANRSGEIKCLEKEVREAEKNIADATFGFEHLMRELGQMYEVAVCLNKLDPKSSTVHLPSLPDIVGKLLLEGHPVELMDGDHGFLPLTWVKAVFQSLANLVVKNRVFVLSVLGIQSSGKSTLLNTMFGLNFAVSAGRCTKGIYAQLLLVAEESGLPFDYMLVIDSEGLRSQELGQRSYEHDNELATLVIGLADLALINMKGENVSEISDVLQIVVHAFLRMKRADKQVKRHCIFVHQNVAAVNAVEKLAADRQKFLEQLDARTKEASEAQDLPETITSFNRIISFDVDSDVVYFPDLWNGDPPMAVVNQGYSTRCAETLHSMLTEMSKNTFGFTVGNFSSRVEDMWNGVLADDFVFSFRNSLVAKTYIEVEREHSNLKSEIEERIRAWVTGPCTRQMKSCKTEPDLEKCFGHLKVELKNEMANMLSKTTESLQTFFDNHPAKNIVIDWKADKETSLSQFATDQEDEVGQLLRRMKDKQSLKIRYQTITPYHEKEIRQKAVDLAKKYKGSQLSDKDLEGVFNDIWKPWANEMIAASRDLQPPSNVKTEVEAMMLEIMERDGNKKFMTRDNQKHSQGKNFVLQDILQEHTKARTVYGRVRKVFMFNFEHAEEVVQKANTILFTVLKYARTICTQGNNDELFVKYHAKQVFDRALMEIKQHNKNETDKWSFTPEFTGMFIRHIMTYVIPEFETMNYGYDKKHGMEAQLSDYKPQALSFFQNTVRDVEDEIAAAQEFCHALKPIVIDHVREQLSKEVKRFLREKIGMSKYDLITKMLDGIAKNKRFNDLYWYVHDAPQYAKTWVKEFGEEELFGKSMYSRYATENITRILHQISEAATNSVLGKTSSDQYHNWIVSFVSSWRILTQQISWMRTLMK